MFYFYQRGVSHLESSPVRAMQSNDNKRSDDEMQDALAWVITLEMNEAFHPNRLVSGECDLIHHVLNDLLQNLATDEELDHGSCPLRTRLHHTASR